MARRDRESARFLTLDSLRWIIRNRAWSWWYIVRYWRFLWFKLRHPHVITRGLVFLGKGVTVEARPGYGRVVLGRWIHLGDHNRLLCHEGVLTIGDKVVLGRDNTIVCYLDVEIGESVLMSDWIYICDFDHVTSDIHVPIKDQGIVKSPVRIGAGTWIGVKASVLRGAFIGPGSVVGSHSVVRGDSYPGHAILAGVPALVVKDRDTAYLAEAATREALADIARKHERAAKRAQELG